MKAIKIMERRRMFEKRYVMKAIRASNNNKARAARLLGVNRTTLIMMMHRLGLGQYIAAPETARYL